MNRTMRNPRKRIITIRDWPIGFKILGSFLLVSIIPIGLIVWFTHIKGREALLNAQVRSLISHARELAESLDRLIEERKRNVSLFAASHGVRGFSAASLEERPALASMALDELQALVRANPNFHMARLLDRNGRVILSTGPEMGADYSFRPYFKEAMEGRVYASDISISVDIGKPVIYFSAPVKDNKGRIVGVAVLRVLAEEVWGLVEKEKGHVGEGDVFTLFDEYGIRLAHSRDRSLIFKAVVPLSPEIERRLILEKRLGEATRIEATDFPELAEGLRHAKEKPYFTHRLAISLETYHSGAAVLKSKPWTVISTLPESSFLLPIRRHTRNLLGFSAAIALLVILITLIATRDIINPIQALERASQRIADGDLDSPVPEMGKAEMGRLAQAMESMRIDLREARDSLIKKSHDLAGLIKAGQAVASSLVLEDVLRSIVFLAAQVMGVSTCGLMLLDEKGGELILQAQIGFPKEWPKDERHRVGVCICGLVASEGRPLAVLDVASERRYVYRDMARKCGFKSYLGVPIRVKGKTIGVLNIYTKQPHAFSEEEIELLSTFADQAGIAIDHATLYGRLEERAKELNLELIREKEFAETVLRSITDGVYVTDLERRILSWSDGGEGITGFRAEEAVGRFCKDFLKHTDDEGRVLCDFACPLTECFRTGRPTPVKDTWVQTMDGRRIPVSVSAAPIRNEEGRIIGAVEVFRDISKERELVRRIQEASRHKSAFLANMSHELRTPLNSIIGFSEVLIDGMAGELNEKQARYINNVLTSGRHLLDLINDILDLSKVEAGKLEFQPEVFRISDALEGAITLVRPMASRTGLHIELEVDERLSTINADPVRFKQIMNNLLSNAIKFTPEGGKVRVAAQLVRSPMSDVRSQEDVASELVSDVDVADELRRYKNFIQIAVSDTGVGIKPGDMPRLFQEFVQLDSTYAKRHQGTGLGLSLTKKLVELHGGRIWAESEGEGKGSTFTFVLPLGKGD